MALLDNVVKQRMVGALVLIAVAVIFLPMLFTREDETRHVQVEAPSAPQAPATSQHRYCLRNRSPATTRRAISHPRCRSPRRRQASSGSSAVRSGARSGARTGSAPAKPAAPAGVDANGLSISWSVQLASMSNRANADNLQKTLRTQGYNAYIRTADGVNRVFVGPLIERAEADRLRDQLDKQQKLKGIVVRFQPERG